MAFQKNLLLFLVGTLGAVSSLTVRQSIPFAPFRMECPKGHGLIELSIRLVASSGGNRRDILYTAACDDLNNMFPLQDELKPLEREECRWTIPINPLNGEDFDSPCTQREYFAGISRLALNPRTSFLCCQLRTRQMSQCVEFAYPQPTIVRPVIQFHHTASVFSALSIRNRKLIAMFCEMETRPIDEISADTTEKPLTTAAAKETSALTTTENVQEATTEPAIRTTEAVTVTNDVTEIQFHTRPPPAFAPVNPQPIFGGISQPGFRSGFRSGPVPQFIPAVQPRFPEFPIDVDRPLPRFFQTPDGRLVPIDDARPDRHGSFGDNNPGRGAPPGKSPRFQFEATTPKSAAQTTDTMLDSFSTKESSTEASEVDANHQGPTPQVLIIPAQTVPSALQAQAAPSFSNDQFSTNFDVTTGQTTPEPNTSEPPGATTSQAELLPPPVHPSAPDFSSFQPFVSPPGSKNTDFPLDIGPPGHHGSPGLEEFSTLSSIPRIPNLKAASLATEQEVVIRGLEESGISNEEAVDHINRQRTIQHVPVVPASINSKPSSAFQGGPGTPPLDAFVFVPGPAPHPAGNRQPLFIELPQIPAIDLEAATGITFPDEENLPPGQTFIEIEAPAPSPSSPAVHRFGAVIPPQVRINNYPRSGYNYHGHRPKSREHGQAPRFFAPSPAGNQTEELDTTDPPSGDRKTTTERTTTTTPFLSTTIEIDTSPPPSSQSTSTAEQSAPKTPKLLVFDAKFKDRQAPRRLVQPNRFFAYTEAETTVTSTTPTATTTTTTPSPKTTHNFASVIRESHEDVSPEFHPSSIHWIAEPAGQKAQSTGANHNQVPVEDSFDYPESEEDGTVRSQHPRRNTNGRRRYEERRPPTRYHQSRQKTRSRTSTHSRRPQQYQENRHQPRRYPPRNSRQRYPSRRRQNSEHYIRQTEQRGPPPHRRWGAEETQGWQTEDHWDTQARSQWNREDTEGGRRREDLYPPARPDSYRRPPPGNKKRTKDKSSGEQRSSTIYIEMCSYVCIMSHFSKITFYCAVVSVIHSSDVSSLWLFLSPDSSDLPSLTLPHRCGPLFGTKDLGYIFLSCRNEANTPTNLVAEL